MNFPNLKVLQEGNPIWSVPKILVVSSHLCLKFHVCRQNRFPFHALGVSRETSLTGIQMVHLHLPREPVKLLTYTSLCQLRSIRVIEESYLFVSGTPARRKIFRVLLRVQAVLSRYTLCLSVPLPACCPDPVLPFQQQI